MIVLDCRAEHAFAVPLVFPPRWRDHCTRSFRPGAAPTMRLPTVTNFARPSSSSSIAFASHRIQVTGPRVRARTPTGASGRPGPGGRDRAALRREPLVVAPRTKGGTPCGFAGRHIATRTPFWFTCSGGGSTGSATWSSVSAHRTRRERAGLIRLAGQPLRQRLEPVLRLARLTVLRCCIEVDALPPEVRLHPRRARRLNAALHRIRHLARHRPPEPRNTLTPVIRSLVAVRSRFRATFARLHPSIRHGDRPSGRAGHLHPMGQRRGR